MKHRSFWFVPVLVCLALLGGPAAGAGAQTPDFPVPGGWHYTQASIREGEFFGYSVVDDAQAPLWTEYRRLGGQPVLGYPVSRRYLGTDGYLYQAFERFILQWRPEQQRAAIANVYEQFTDAGLDDWLVLKGIPKPQPPTEGTFEEEARRRMGWLTEARFLGFYLLHPLTQQPWDFYEQAWDFYGLPQTGPARLTRTTPGAPALWPFLVQRFQKVAFQLWLEDGPEIPRGSVSIVTGGTLARLSGLVPLTAALPEPPPSATPWLIGTPSLSGQPAEQGLTRHFAIGGAGFAPGETVTLSLVPSPEEVAENSSLTSVTLTATAKVDGSFVVEGDALPATYTVSARGATSGASVGDTLVLS